jgi:hypothetical protein
MGRRCPKSSTVFSWFLVVELSIMNGRGDSESYDDEEEEVKLLCCVE